MKLETLSLEYSALTLPSALFPRFPNSSPLLIEYAYQRKIANHKESAHGTKDSVITPDQMRYDALGCNGGQVARTPILDGLAANGIRYTRA